MEVILGNVTNKAKITNDNGDLRQIGYNVEATVFDDEGESKKIDIFFIESEFPESRAALKEKIKSMIRGDDDK